MSKHALPPHAFRKKVFVIIGSFLAVIFGMMAFLVGKELGYYTKIACIVYSIMVTVVFVVQLYGFVISQIDYSDEVEQPKFEILKLEEKEWAAWSAKYPNS